jgi:hypothetical protein
MANIQNILDLVPGHLKPLFPLEEKLIQAAPLGIIASCFPEGPIDMAQIGEAESVRSEVLIWLLTDSDICKNIHHKGIHLRGAKILGVLDLRDTTLDCPLRLRNCIINEKMIFNRGNFNLLDFSCSQTGSIFADRVQVQHDILMRNGFKAKGKVRLLGANIGGELNCTGGEFENPGGDALIADSFSVTGDVFLRNGFKAKGEVRLLGANIGGGLDCSGGKFENPDGDALSGDSFTVIGAVFLRNGFKAKGVVRFLGANIGGDLDCHRGEFENPDGVALNGDGFTVIGAVILGDGFKAKGAVRLLGVKIGTYLNCEGGEFENPGGDALNGANMKVDGSFRWCSLAKKPVGELVLENARLANLEDDENSWPESGQLNIDGLIYGPFSSQVPSDWKTRLKWLNLRNPDDFNVQPYEQLIHVFQQMGLREDARNIAIARQRVIQQHQRGISRFWSWILDITIAHGYKPEKVIGLFIVPIILFGAILFTLAFQAGVMESTATPQHSPGKSQVFDPVGYSLDVFLPIVDLHQESAWEPNAGKEYGLLVQYYMYFHILAGWFFTTLAVAALTGLVRSD